MLLLGAGPRALLLQIAHPAIAEGVDRFSGFREDPWSRLRATIGSYLQIVYGSPGEADAEITRLARLHGVIRGPVRDREARARGFVAFDATDPELSLWVHATLVESTIVAFDAWIEPLSREQRERYYAETVPLGLAFGIPAERLPANLAGLEAYVGEMIGAGGPVAPTPLARELSETILHPPLGTVHSALASVRPLLDAIPAAVYDWTLWPSIGLLPGRIREAYGIPFGTFERAVAAWLVGGWRAWRPLLPAAFRHMPQARAADHRIARRGISSSAGSASGRWARGRAGSPRQGP
jgi:uncharacterized protein (DUF2236 family)